MFLKEPYAVVSIELTTFHLPERSWTALSGFLSSLTAAGALGTEWIGADFTTAGADCCTGADCTTGDSDCCAGAGRDGDSTLATTVETESLNLFINTAAAAITTIANTANPIAAG